MKKEMKRNRGKEPKTEFHEGVEKKRRNNNDASQLLALPEKFSEHRRDLLSNNLSSSPSAANNSKLEPVVADSLSMADPNSELTPDPLNYVSSLKNELSLTDPNSELTPDLADYVSFLENILSSDDQPPSAAASNSKPHPKLANSGSVVKNDPLLADPHPLAATNSSVQLQSQQTEHQSLISGGLLQEDPDWVNQFLNFDESELEPDVANSASVVENDVLLAYPHPVEATSASVQLQPQQPEHLSSTRRGLLQEDHDWVKQLLFSNDSEIHPNVANSASVVENDALLAYPHHAAATSASVHLQPEHLSSTREGLLPEHFDWSELHRLSYEFASSLGPNNYAVEATDKDSRTIRFKITDRSSLEEVRTEVARRFEMGRFSFWMENVNINDVERRSMVNDRDLSLAIGEATCSGSRLIQLKVHKF